MSVLYMAANNSGCWKLRASGFSVGWFMSPAGLRRPVKGEAVMPYALDNGLFHPFDQPPKPDAQRLRIVGSLARIVTEGWPLPLFAVVPDVPYRGDASWRVSLYWRGVMRDLFPSIPLAVAVQDGMSAGMLDGYDWCAIAGSTEWKLKTMDFWSREAKRRGMGVHLLRANTRGRIQLAKDCGCDSADGTGIWRGDRNQKRGVLEELVQLGLFQGKDAA